MNDGVTIDAVALDAALITFVCPSFSFPQHSSMRLLEIDSVADATLKIEARYDSTRGSVEQVRAKADLELRLHWQEMLSAWYGCSCD